MPNKSRWIHCAECGRNRLHAGHGLCKQCYDRQWREDHPGYQCQWGEKNQERKARYNRQWRENNCKHKAEYDSQWREEHPEYYSEYKRRWGKANREKRREAEHRYRARKANVTIKPIDGAAIYELYGRICIYCGATENLTLDHIVALDNGGAHSEDNLVVACLSCNCSKHIKPLLDWLRTQPRVNAWLY